MENIRKTKKAAGNDGGKYRKKYRVVDLFSGVGGLSFGFSSSPHFEIVAANEILPTMARAYAANHPGVKVYNCDIRDFSSRQLFADLGVTPGSIDIVVGGPPCQPFSTVGKRLSGDPRAELFKEYHRMLVELQPSMFVFENVRGLLSVNGGQLMGTIVSMFEGLGYDVQHRILNAADFGAPQHRHRVIMVGTKGRQRYVFPQPTHGDPEGDLRVASGLLKPYVTLEEAIGDLPLIGPGEKSRKYASAPRSDFQRQMRKNAPNSLTDHDSPNHNKDLVRIMEALPDGGTPLDIPKAIRPKSGYKNTYSRLWWNRPSTTITRNLGTPSSSRCVHPKAPRALTTREGARLQSFPDYYRFVGSRSEKNLQIGNAVPAVLSTALAESILMHFSKQVSIADARKATALRKSA